MEGLVCIFLQAVPFQRRVDLEVNGVECIWLEMLFPYSKSFLIVLFTDHQTRQDITQKDFEAQFESALSTVASENKA